MIEQLLQADRLMQVDQVRQAREIYQRVVDLDPGNAIAVVGLARCALADGDEAGAHVLAVQALSIDPENDMARRMEARLAEILAARGEAVARPALAEASSGHQLRALMTETPEQESGASPTLAQQPTPAARPAMRKSFLDRLLGR